MKKVISVVLIIVLLGGIVVANAENENAPKGFQETKTLSFTIEEAVKYALEHNRDLKIQDIEIEKASLDSSKTIFEVSKYGDYEIVNKKMRELGVHRRAGKLMTDKAHWNKDIVLNEITYNTTKRYYDLYKAAEMMDIAKNGLDLAENIYEQGVLKHKLGTISSQQLLFIETELKEAESNLGKAKLAYELQMMNFNNELGLPLSTDIQLTSKISYTKLDGIDLEGAVKEGIENNAILKSLREAYEISKLTLEAISAKYTHNTFVYKEQKIIQEETLRNLENSSNNIEFQIRGSYLTAKSEEESIKSYEKSVEKAENIYNLTVLSFDVGEATVNDVTSSRIGLMNAKVELLNKVHSFNVAMLDFEYSKGLGKIKVN